MKHGIKLLTAIFLFINASSYAADHLIKPMPGYQIFDRLSAQYCQVSREVYLQYLQDMPCVQQIDTNINPHQNLDQQSLQHCRVSPEVYLQHLQDMQQQHIDAKIPQIMPILDYQNLDQQNLQRYQVLYDAYLQYFLQQDCPRPFVDARKRKIDKCERGELPRIKKYGCAICHETFASGFSAKRHMKVHTGEKPFECNKCGHRFAEKHSLKNHLFGVHCIPIKKAKMAKLVDEACALAQDEI